jgi:hypothetical protein
MGERAKLVEELTDRLMSAIEKRGSLTAEQVASALMALVKLRSLALGNPP